MNALTSTDGQAEWEVWYRDTFDRECPPRVEARGRGLAAGLLELWARHLFETVRPDGGPGFSRFHLRSGQTSVAVDGSPEGARRLRAWVFGSQAHTERGYVAAADRALLRRVAAAHARLLMSGQTAAPILDAAAAAPDRRAFERQLDTWIESL